MGTPEWPIQPYYFFFILQAMYILQYKVSSKSSTKSSRPTSRYILFDGENISFDASLVLYIYKEY